MAYGQQQQTVSAQEAGRPQPQTTVEANGGPFLRHTQPGRATQYSTGAQALGSVITNPLVARPGYFRNFRVTHTFSGGSQSGATVAADAPFNVSALTTLKDAFGTPLIIGDGYTVSNLLPIYSGGFGLNNGTNFASNLPSYTALNAAGSAGSFSYALPLEFAKGYGVLSAANASLLPTLQFNLATQATVFTGTITGTAPSVSTTVSSDFYWLPEGVNGAAAEPPGLGTTRQWLVQQANPQISGGSAARLQFPRMGGYLDTIIVTIRDSNGARSDSFMPTRPILYVDGVPLIDTLWTELQDDMAIQYGFGGSSSSGLVNSTRPTGTMVFSRKTSLNQQSLGLLDTGEQYLSTNPGTLVELAGSPWNGSGTATANVCVGQIVPTGALVTGLPEL